MNISSKVLTDGIAFALTIPKIKDWLAKRDQSPKASIESIRTFVGRPNTEHRILPIRILIDYHAYTQDAAQIEDIVIDIAWNPTTGYNLVRARLVPEV